MIRKIVIFTALFHFFFFFSGTLAVCASTDQKTFTLVELEEMMTHYEKEVSISREMFFCDDAIAVIRVNQLRQDMWNNVAPDDELIAYLATRLIKKSVADNLYSTLVKMPGLETDAEILNKAAARYRELKGPLHLKAIETA